MTKYYEVGYKKPQWKLHPHDVLIKRFETKEDALKMRTQLKNAGHIQTYIKLKKGETALTDY